jgi:hypothetical protein
MQFGLRGNTAFNYVNHNSRCGAEPFEEVRFHSFIDSGGWGQKQSYCLAPLKAEDWGASLNATQKFGVFLLFAFEGDISTFAVPSLVVTR